MTLAGLGEPASAGIALTMCVYTAMLALHRRAGVGHVVNPTILTIAVVAAILALTGIPYASYMRGGAMIQFTLSLAGVLLAVPLVEEGRRLARAMPVLVLAILIALPFGAAVGAATAMLFGADVELIRSLLPRSITAGVSATTGERVGGLAPVAGMADLLTGVATAILGPTLLRLAGVRSPTAFGLTMGLHGHAIGVAQSNLVRPDSLPYARVGMSSAMIAGAFLIPLLQAGGEHPLHLVQPAMAAPVRERPERRDGGVPWILATETISALGVPLSISPDRRILQALPVTVGLRFKR